MKKGISRTFIVYGNSQTVSQQQRQSQDYVETETTKRQKKQQITDKQELVGMFFQKSIIFTIKTVKKQEITVKPGRLFL